MPKEGYKTITIREPVFKALKIFADQRYLTIPRAIEFLIDKQASNSTPIAKEGSS